MTMFRISVFNRAADERIGEYYAGQVPAVGDFLAYSPDDERGPFGQWGMWQVANVMWTVALRGSPAARETARKVGMVDSAAYCTWVEVHVWPAQGPHWADTPPWANTLRAEPDDDADESTEDGD